MSNEELVNAAILARQKSYSPYSSYQVGAALLASNGKVYTGCNVENASYGATNCAERTAFFKAVSEGEREFRAIAIVGSPKGEVTQYAFPCGICRQVMREFCNPTTFQVIVAKAPNDYQVYYLSELLPESFGPENVT